ncbi:MAG: hypothetical protein PVI86_15410, partial [Phycisphaerae bacterium]
MLDRSGNLLRRAVLDAVLAALGKLVVHDRRQTGIVTGSWIGWLPVPALTLRCQHPDEVPDSWRLEHLLVGATG